MSRIIGVLGFQFYQLRCCLLALQPSLPSRRGKGSLPLALMPPSRDTADVAAEQLQQQLGDVLQRLVRSLSIDPEALVLDY